MTKILIVEDEAGLRQGLEINLRHENYETVTAADGDEAIRLFHAESPDLVLLAGGDPVRISALGVPVSTTTP